MKKSYLLIIVLIAICCSQTASGQVDTAAKKGKDYKNIIRYNLSGALLFGIDKYIVFGYERVVSPKQSFSINVGRASLPKLVSFTSDSFALKGDRKNTGFNISLDYRFYLAKENKYNAPHGVYVGPYMAYSQMERKNSWIYENGAPQQSELNTTANFDFFTVGAEIGYQFIFWKRLAVDLVMVGPGFTNYQIKGTIESNLSENAKKRLQNAMKQMITQRFPGMNYILSDEQFDGSGTIGTWNVGYRYLIHIGFAF